MASEGIAAVVDPQRDVDIYIDAAREHNVKIAHIIETHLHADFVSGHHELARRTGAQIYLGDRSGATFPHVSVRHNHEIAFGQCRLRFLQTPGHTVESMCVVVTDLERGPEPWAVLTGDTLFIGDVGRPDLADTHTPQELASLLYDSLQNQLLTLPDSVVVYPAHGAGSMCGRNIGSDRSSTIGRERQLNYALQPMTREQFVRIMTDELPVRPEYFQRDVELNRRGAATLADLPALHALPPYEVARLQRDGTTILDTRVSGHFCSGHIAGSINIGLNGQFAAWAGSVLGLDRELILVAEDSKAVEESRQRLARVGIERVRGFVDEGIAGWIRNGMPLQQIGQISVHELQAELRRDPDFSVLDVRRPSEWNDGHVARATHSPLDHLQKRLGDLNRTGKTAVYCKGGYRSSIACSLLQASGFGNVLNVLGGFDAWSAAELPVTKS